MINKLTFVVELKFFAEDAGMIRGKTFLETMGPQIRDIFRCNFQNDYILFTKALHTYIHEFVDNINLDRADQLSLHKV